MALAELVELVDQVGRLRHTDPRRTSSSEAVSRFTTLFERYYMGN